jgi:hypothetical protein
MQPQKKEKIGHELGQAMMEFLRQLTENQFGPKDDVLRQVATENTGRLS